VGYTAQPKQRNLLSELTMEGISITGGLSCVKIITFFYSVIICRIGSTNSEPMTFFSVRNCARTHWKSSLDSSDHEGKQMITPHLEKYKRGEQSSIMCGW